jgi:hypothetical protein
MVLPKRDKTGTVLAGACCVTALLNTVCSTALAQETQRVMPLQPNPPASDENLLRYGDFDVRPHLKIGSMYDDNIFISPNDEQDDFLWVFTPGVLIGSGDYGAREDNYVFINYEPDFIVFTDHSDQNDIDHDARLAIQRRPGNWTLNLQQDFATYSGPTVDVGRRVNETVYTTLLGAKYDISPKTSAEIHGSQIIDNYDTTGVLDGYNEWIIESWADYGLTPKLKVGGGLTAGWVDVQGSANQTYQQPLLRFLYALTGKVDLRASAGAEFRQFQDNDEDRADFVASLGSTYRPIENTALTLDAFHRNQNSVLLVNQNSRASGITASLRQDFLVKYHFYLGGGYEFLDYYATQPGVAAPRQDDYYFVRTGVNWDLNDRINLGLFYQFRKNDSNVDTYSFDDNQVGLTFAYRF